MAHLASTVPCWAAIALQAHVLGLDRVQCCQSGRQGMIGSFTLLRLQLWQAGVLKYAALQMAYLR